jgi:hypothetical protein
MLMPLARFARLPRLRVSLKDMPPRLLACNVQQRAHVPGVFDQNQINRLSGSDFSPTGLSLDRLLRDRCRSSGKAWA